MKKGTSRTNAGATAPSTGTTPPETSRTSAGATETNAGTIMTPTGTPRTSAGATEPSAGTTPTNESRTSAGATEPSFGSTLTAASRNGRTKTESCLRWLVHLSRRRWPASHQGCVQLYQLRNGIRPHQQDSAFRKASEKGLRQSIGRRHEGSLRRYPYGHDSRYRSWRKRTSIPLETNGL